MATFHNALLLMASCAFLIAAVNGDFTMPTPVMSSDIICWDQCQYFEENQTFAIISSDNNRTSAMGVAYYSTGIRMKDPSTGTVASFNTTFTFREQPMEYNTSTSNPYAGEGFTFMMSTSSSWTGDAAGRFGIFDALRPSKVVAIEFDSWQSDDTDPGILPNNGTMNEHVALDVGSPISVTSCFAYVYYYRAGITFSKGDVLYSWIEYDGITNTLQVRLANTPTRPVKALVYCQYDLSGALEEKMWIGFSGSTGDHSSVYYIYNWTFTSYGISNELIGAGPSRTPFPVSSGPKSSPSGAGAHPAKAPSPSSEPSSKSSTVNVGLIVGVICGILLALAAVAAYGVRAYQRKIRNQDKSWDNQEIIEMGGMPEFISYKDLSVATKKFSDHSKLGQGGFGSVYKGVLPKTGAQVAVKKVSNDSRQGEREFLAEIKIISQLRHRNVVELMGYCRDRRKFLLVYEFLPRGSLDQALFKPKFPEGVLSWSQRWKIVSGTAAALHYLHEGWRQQVIHRDVKSSNIMLDEEHNPKLGDFGLARLVDHQKVATTTMVAGTFGYIAPEAAGGKFTDKTDVYAFGAVALEVACGRKAYDPRVKNCDDLILKDLVWRHLRKDELLSVVDPLLSERFDVEQMYIVLKLGLLCSHPDPSFRPSMRQVVQVMAGDADVPDVRQSMPDAPLASDLPHLSIAELLHSRSGSQNSKSSDKRPESSASVPSSSSYCSSSRLNSQLFPR
ncbi:hypothetical protein M758_1G157700 [Ceratodon purpureus]|uniref:Protein kinase domain-containing protein n=1 Tax=Ceratodon purpureus TaxID=3225 RepID=A0A8T0J8Q5_CERPU|nr:hypothetical protein KC19_1G161900 [Ceratodon purpureus]KAG0630154.1 hypothetical protein M758_1G157700 [Ceratodon purpureus]